MRRSTVTVGVLGDGIGWEVCCSKSLGLWLVGECIVHALRLWYLGLGCTLALGIVVGPGDVAQLRGLLGLWVMHNFPWEDILLDGEDILSSSVVVFTLGLDDVALGSLGLVNEGAGMYNLWSAEDRKSTSWLGSSWDSGFMLMDFLK